MAVDYTPGTSGDLAVAKSIARTSANQVNGDEDVDYAAGQSTCALVKPVMSPNIRVVKGSVTSSSVTGEVGIG